MTQLRGGAYQPSYRGFSLWKASLSEGLERRRLGLQGSNRP